MRVLLSLAGAAFLALGVWAAPPAAAAEDPAQTPAKPAPAPDAPKSRQDWPRERIIVKGKRGSLRDWLSNHTVRGTEGFADGSAPSEVESRTEYVWQVYYAPDGKLEAHFSKIGARVPHGPLEELNYVEFGRWRIDEDGDVCQTIPKVGWGVELCSYVERRANRVAFYYTRCGAFNRCYAGRLGPEGEIVPGRSFTR